MSTTNTHDFENLNLDEMLLKGLYLYGFKKPSYIQYKGIEAINSGKDCILQSQSGTGKTATYLLGILNRLVNDNKQGIIITPTRELSEQVYNVGIEISKYTDLKIELCTGGMNLMKNRNNIKSHNLIIGTLGRINHMITEKRFNSYNIKLLIIDEPDQLLAEGTPSELQNIINFVNDGVQMCFISATMSPNVFKLASNVMDDPVKILIKKNEIPVDLIKQFYIDVEIEELKFEVLLDLYSLISSSQVILFCNTVKKVEWISNELEKNNFSITSIHGKMSTQERNIIVKDFRDGKTRILLTTDLLSRGIDIPHVNLVINYDIPPNKETYIHRIGRCGRFGKKGVAISFVKTKDQLDTKCFSKMKGFYDIKIEELPDNIDEYL